MSESELAVARRLAASAGHQLRDALGRGAFVERKAPLNLVTEVDRSVERLIVSGLREAFPGQSIVAEESADGRVQRGDCWYVDPLDGTTNFVHGLPHCAVSIALVDAGGPRVAVVNDPFREEMFEAERGHGATLNGQPLRVSATETLGDGLLVTGFPYDRRDHLRFYLSYLEAFLRAAIDVRRFGSAALDLCYVAAGRFDGFWEWKLQPWDTAAGWLIVQEAGGRVSDFSGAAFDPWGPQILATNGRIHDAALAVLRSLEQEPSASSGGRRRPA
jgi:myo-inositol-1(or 4)-monophosphatase